MRPYYFRGCKRDVKNQTEVLNVLSVRFNGKARSSKLYISDFGLSDSGLSGWYFVAKAHNQVIILPYDTNKLGKNKTLHISSRCYLTVGELQ